MAIDASCGFRVALATGALSIDDLRADMLFVTPGAALARPSDPEFWSALLWRIGAEAYRFLLLAAPVSSGGDLAEWGIADQLIPDGENAALRVQQWLAARSSAALVSAVSLTRSRGGDTLERFEFARLFAAGVPQEGLAAFLEKRRPRWSRG